MLLLVDFHAVNRYASIGANRATTGAPGASIGIRHISIVVTFIVYFFLLERKHLEGASGYAYIAALAALFVNYYSSF